VARLWPAVPRAVTPVLVALALALGLAAGGCSMSYQFDSLFAKASDKEATGSINPPPGAKPTAELPPEGDLVYTRAAVTEVFNRGGKDASVPWENPQTGARGTVTPIATAYNQAGAVCQDFLASYVRGSLESWLRGEACREPKGKWEVRSLKPWKRT